MKILAAATCSILLTTGCVASSGRVSALKPPAPDVATGTWDFVVTCISGTWYQARLLSAPQGQVSRPAYQYQAGKLEILLSTELCDAYTSFIGNVSGSVFEGSHVSYGLFGSTEHGKVGGALRH